MPHNGRNQRHCCCSIYASEQHKVSGRPKEHWLLVRVPLVRIATERWTLARFERVAEPDANNV